MIKKAMYASKTYILELLGILLLIDVFFVKMIYEFFVLIIFILIVTTIINYRIKKSKIVLTGLGIMFLIPLFLSFRLGFIAEKIAVWSYILLIIAFFMHITEDGNIPTPSLGRIIKKRRSHNKNLDQSKVSKLE